MIGELLPIVTVPTGQFEDRPATWFDHDRREWHRFGAGERNYLLVADRSRIYEIDGAAFDESAGTVTDYAQESAALADWGISLDTAEIDAVPREPLLRALSLAVSQKCNLGCTYCYAQEGSFGGTPRNMSREVALAAVERLFVDARPGESVHLSFLGGEPLLNRQTLRAAAIHAQKRALELDVRLGLSITTNGTLLTVDDAEFFEEQGFAVTISLDGLGERHDVLRPFKNGVGSFSQILERIHPLLMRQRRMQVSARVTVTPRNLALRETLEGLLGLGFHSVGFSPLLSSPTGRDEMHIEELGQMLEQMLDCGKEFERRVERGERYPFSNLTNALHEIHRGTHRPYSCGAGAGYFGVSAEGELFACHRFVDDSAGALGHVSDGVDRDRQSKWLTARHVHQQEPCSGCWARYLCGGGCHHEVLHRGRPACDYIRGWLHYCLQAYARLLERRPNYFAVE